MDKVDRKFRVHEIIVVANEQKYELLAPIFSWHNDKLMFGILETTLKIKLHTLTSTTSHNF